jgi:4-hydroxy 2-oxovalerate aldolase
MENKNRIQILDCSLRDGGYVNNWGFPKGLARESYRALSKSGVDIVELGFRSSDKHFDARKYGLWRFCDETVLREVTENIRGASVCVMGDYGKIELDDLVDAHESVVDLVRIAVHKDRVLNAIDFLEKVKGKGYQVSLQAMGYSTYTDLEKQSLLSALAHTDLDYVYIADSYGSILPFQIKPLFEPFQEIGGIRLGFHPHNNIQMAFANTLEAIRVGVDIVDTTIYGIGRGAGNLPTEILLSYLQLQGNDRYNVIPVLNCIERYFLGLKEETPWGYQLPYMISGIFNSHPSYSMDLIRRREYSMEDIWKALGCVREIAPVGFDASIVDGLIEKGLIGEKRATAAYGNIPSSAVEEEHLNVNYIQRHAGREFLVLANGPSLKSCRLEIESFIAKYDPIILGANFLNNLFVPHYHAFNNQKRFVSHVKYVSPDSRLLIGTNISSDIIDDYVNCDYELLVFRNILDAKFDISKGRIMANCRTISVLLIGVAVVMGAKRVFVAGMDGYLYANSANSTLFYEEEFDPEAHEINLRRHQYNESFLNQIDGYIRRQGGEGIHVLTPTGHSSFYKSIEEYL